jgi:integration host factor subunit alpha
MGALTKSEMAERLYEELGLNKREAKEIVELFFEEIRACLEGNEQVKLSGFGNFDLRDKSQRPGRNPKTGEEIPISARRVVTFRPGQKLKARVETYGEEQAARLRDDNREDNREDNETPGDDSESPEFFMRTFDGGSEQ